MTFPAPTEPRARGHSDGVDMRELPDSSTLKACPLHIRGECFHHFLIDGYWYSLNCAGRSKAGL